MGPEQAHVTVENTRSRETAIAKLGRPVACRQRVLLKAINQNIVAPYAWRLSLAGCEQPDKGISPNKKARQADLFIVSDQPDSDLFEDQRTVSPTEAEGVTQGILHTANPARFVRNEVQIATFIRVIRVDGWWYSLIAQRENRVD